MSIWESFAAKQGPRVIDGVGTAGRSIANGLADLTTPGPGEPDSLLKKTVKEVGKATHKVVDGVVNEMTRG